MNKDKDERQTIDILLEAITDGQETVRAIDLKAEILTAILTLLVGFTAYVWNDDHSAIREFLEATIAVLATVSLLLLLAVLYPAYNPIKAVNKGRYVPKGTFFLSQEAVERHSVAEIAEWAKNTDWVAELTFELMKVSSIRHRKATLFKYAAQVSFIIFMAVGSLCFMKTFS